MPTLAQVMQELRSKANAQTQKTLIRHGAPPTTLGVKIGDLKIIAKRFKSEQALAHELYKTAVVDAMYLAGIIADGAAMSKKQLDSWAKGANCHIISEYAVPGVAVESPHARDLALKWIDSKKEPVAACGWSTYAGMLAVQPDDQLDLAEIRQLLCRVVETIDAAPNRVRYAMNSFVIAVGAYVKPLLKDAKRAAKAIGAVDVDMDDTACKTPVAADYIAKIESLGRIGAKRKSIKC